MSQSQEVAQKELAATITAQLGEYKDYDSQLPIADREGARFVTCCYKQTDKMKAAGIAAKQNQYVFVPADHLAEQHIIDSVVELAPFIQQWLQGEEDKVIRADHKAGILNVYTDSYSLERVMGILEEAGKGGSIDSEQITEWFTNNVADKLTALICNKWELEPDSLDVEQLAKVTTVVQANLNAFISLAGGNTKMGAQQRARLTKLLGDTETAETQMGERFTKRFIKMANDENEKLKSLGDY